MEPTEHQRWINQWGDKRRYDFHLNQNSVVFDVGAYKGEWAAKIFSKYQCNIYVFEPIKEYYDEISHIFGSNGKIMTYNSALLDRSGKSLICMDGDGSSMFNEHPKNMEVSVINFNNFIYDNAINRIDLMKINIEGAEYDLLESIITSGNHNKIQNMLIQFHHFVEDYEIRREKIQHELSKTHEQVFNYEMIWESWRAK